ncbi:hypothetical protein [Janibacter alkaliphilus]|uniref:Uncharacterized protein n=1 Tax=Janibacter alkaliphilus TaxID=1069963 RepID=A0A852XAJ6_9MICO|nr:hypothetical protein [Janibacter alkaliphilus]NYG37384.1 hypothetical protein [Janibacter alkaliphilus]
MKRSLSMLAISLAVVATSIAGSGASTARSIGYDWAGPAAVVSR